MSRKRSRTPGGDETKPAVSKHAVEVWLHRFLIVASTVAAYAGSFDGAFIFDDYDRILDEPAVRHVFPLSDHFATRRPLVSLSLAINHAVGGFEVWGYHAFNLAVHLLAALTLYALVRRVLIESSRLGWESRSASRFACATALLWAVHPLQTQSVTYIIQRGESLASLFYLLTLYCVLRASRHRIALWGGLAIFACACGMASKAIAVTLPVMAIVYDRALLAASWREFGRRWWLHAGLVTTWLVLVACGVTRGLISTGDPGAQATVGFGVGDVSPWEYAASQPGVILHYLRLVFWPHPLVLDYGWPAETNATLIAVQAAVLLFLIVAALWSLKRYPGIAVAGIGFFIILAPTSSIVPVRDLAFEHRMYLPLACVLIVVLAVVRAAGIRFRDRQRLPAAMFGAITGGVLFVVATTLAAATYARSEDYKSPLRMWRDVAERRPENSRAFANIGWLLMRQGDMAGAEKATREAIRLREDYTDAYVGLGEILKHLGSHQEAVQAFEAALRDGRDSAAARTNLIPYLLSQGRVEEAVEYGKKAISLRPNMVEAHANYGLALKAQGDTSGALAEFRKAIELNPDALQAHFNMGMLLLELGRFAEAEAAFCEVVRILPSGAEGHYFLGIAMANQGRVSEAVAAFRATLKLDPSHAGARRQLELAPRQ